MRSALIVAAVAAVAAVGCGAAPRTIDLAPPPPAASACPQSSVPEYAWTHELFPGCPAKPLVYRFPVCGFAPCPRPCRATKLVADRDPEIKTFTYDARGRWLATHVPGEDGIYESCDYDGDRLTNCRHGDRVEFVRDAQRRITLVRDLDMPNSATAIRYDARGDLVETDDTFHGDRSWFAYDAAHRLVHERATFGTVLDATAPETSWRYRYDPTGRLVEVEQRWTNVPDLRRIAITYDGMGRMATLDVHAGTETLTLIYDTRGRLAGDSARAGGQQASTRYDYECR